MLAQDAEDHRQTETTPGELGGKKGFEYPAGAVVVDAAAVVPDLDQDALARTVIAADDGAGELLIGERDGACAHPYVPAILFGFFERLAGVFDQVYDGLMKLARIAVNERQLRRQVECQADAVGQGADEQRFPFDDELRHVDRHGDGR